ncbi:hypothetical protein KDK_57980 [Dictyobacter kobayashii]|uniref:Uncharacterized protein n=1 Tax=Dictyobacter kobayashii TaxID=2014872 RepID=A0A402ASB0_9CHLR|nr:hypothetical protein KDK_57980 [Dictyobacter kobayashii]
MSQAFYLANNKELYVFNHILHGVLNPLEGIGPKELRIAGLLQSFVQGELIKKIWKGTFWHVISGNSTFLTTKW